MRDRMEKGVRSLKINVICQLIGWCSRLGLIKFENVFRMDDRGSILCLENCFIPGITVNFGTHPERF